MPPGSPGRAYGIGTPAVLSRNLGEALAADKAVITAVNAQVGRRWRANRGADWAGEQGQVQRRLRESSALRT